MNEDKTTWLPYWLPPLSCHCADHMAAILASPTVLPLCRPHGCHIGFPCCPAIVQTTWLPYWLPPLSCHCADHMAAILASPTVLPLCRPHGYHIGFPCCPAIVQNTLSSVRICLSLSEFDCLLTLRNETLPQSVYFILPTVTLYVAQTVNTEQLLHYIL
jgi:hypothetical protein